MKDRLRLLIAAERTLAGARADLGGHWDGDARRAIWQAVVYAKRAT